MINIDWSQLWLLEEFMTQDGGRIPGIILTLLYNCVGKKIKLSKIIGFQKRFKIKTDKLPFFYCLICLYTISSSSYPLLFPKWGQLHVRLVYLFISFSIELLAHPWGRTIISKVITVIFEGYNTANLIFYYLYEPAKWPYSTWWEVTMSIVLSLYSYFHITDSY